MAQEPNFHPGPGVREHLQDLVLECADVAEMLGELATFSASTLSVDNDVLCGVTLVRRRKPVTVATSEPRVHALDELQYGLGEGPCLAAVLEMTLVHIPDLREERRWPRYVAAAWAEGVGSILCIPLPLEGEANAALNLYSPRTNAFSGEDIGGAEAYAAQASKALRLAVRVAQLTDDRTNLTTAMVSRTTIDVAVGAIMAQNRCSQESALKILKIASSTRNMKLRDVAAAVVASVSNDPKVLTHFDS
ncbi:GAF and ANTAR domain-containing protein [Paenarthrobacter aurescens]|jgi:GAF domain-containing protein|uniref:ANTAR domain protein n=1 Tax=Paenarthrobacter aurescens (strain TC1) TaxID=290340 RepID=A1RDS8_PAEAT|nr:GAF and ANTAR domain-containing protein [Paenarthrobacter aurescens]ABM10607.1 ANTAR domain protein [Paenarthrobacter aurescens TC1]